MFIASAILFCFISSCKTTSTKNTQDTAAIKSDGTHHNANGCEIFVDKVLLYRSSHALTQAIFYLKTHNNDLDSPISRVGFRYEKNETDGFCRNSSNYNQYCEGLGEWKEDDIDSFFGAKDYFGAKSYFLSSDYNPTLDYKGTFFVQTENGTYYWLKTKDDQDISFSSHMFNDWERDGQGIQTVYGNDNINSFKSTADSSQRVKDMFNPRGCR